MVGPLFSIQIGPGTSPSKIPRRMVRRKLALYRNPPRDSRKQINQRHRRVAGRQATGASLSAPVGRKVPMVMTSVPSALGPRYHRLSVAEAHSRPSVTHLQLRCRIFCFNKSAGDVPACGSTSPSVDGGDCPIFPPWHCASSRHCQCDEGVRLRISSLFSNVAQLERRQTGG